MNLLYLNHNVTGTGTYFRALHFGRVLAARGHDVTLVTTSRTRRWKLEERDIHGVRQVEAPDLWWGPARTGWDGWNTLRRMLRVRRLDVDLIHAFDGRPAVSLPALYVKRRTGAPLVMDWADWWGRGGHIQQRSGWTVRTFFGPIETWFEEAFRPVADANTVISSALHGRVLRMGVDPARTLVIPQGCDVAGIQPADRCAARAALGLSARQPLVVHLGTLTRGDMEFLAAAMRAVRRRLPDARLVLVGQPRPRVPADLAAAGGVQVTGYIDAALKNAWVHAADVCVVAMPDTLGHRGRWPSKINDYFSAARPTVIPAVGDAAALVSEHALGWVTAPDPASFGAGILAALENPREAEQAGLRARRVAEQYLAWPVLAEHVERLYRVVLECRTRERPELRGSFARSPLPRQLDPT